jgi:glutathione S-transferase
MAAEELELKFQLIPVLDNLSKEFRRLNPNGRIPVIDDDGVILFESLAINLYLAEKYGTPPLWPESVADHGACYQWSFWAANEIERDVMVVMWNTALLPKERRQPEAAVQSQRALIGPLKSLNEHLGEREHLLGREFTIADLNVAEMVSVGDRYGVDLSGLEALKMWLARCLARPAYQRACQYP